MTFRRSAPAEFAQALNDSVRLLLSDKTDNLGGRTTEPAACLRRPLHLGCAHDHGEASFGLA